MKPRLLIILNRFVIGGQALDTIPLAYYLRNEFDIKIIYGCKETDETEPWFLLEKYKGLSFQNIPSLHRSINPLQDIKAYYAIQSVIKKFSPHIVHTHGAKSGLLGRYAAKNLGVPVILHTFHGHLFHSYFNSFFTRKLIGLEKWLLKFTTRVIALSDTQKKELQNVLHVPAGKLVVIPLGIDYIDGEKHITYRSAFRSLYKISDNAICIGMLGRIVPIKNTLFFLQVATYVLKKYPLADVRFFIVGDGNEKEKLIQYLDEQDVIYNTGTDKDKVVFTSWVNDIQSVLDGLDIVALTSFNEGTPMSLIEAQMCVKPIVAVNVGGVADTMIAGETGYLLQHHNVVDFSEALIKLSGNDAIRKTMGAKGKSFAKDRFSKDAEVKSFSHLYHLLLKEQNIYAK